MSDLDPQTRDLRQALNPTDGRRKETRNIPPLVWIVIVVLIAVAALAYYGRDKNWITPHGGSTPATQDSGAMPASNAGG
jgi:ribose/xylose/arabinose/galactoside ABC-type transport system permease subunit